MTKETDDVLAQNVATLLEAGGDPPAIDGAARARIRAQLIARHAAPARLIRRSFGLAIGLGLMTAVAAALILGRWFADPAQRATRDPAIAGADIVTAPGAKVVQLAPRHLRVEGAALIDVAPGHGPFVVETAHGRIDVLGTRFLVDGAADRTTAAVVRGEVKLATADGDVTLHAGEQAIAERGHPPVRSPAPRLSHLASWAQDARRRDEHAPAVHHGTLFARDPGVRSHPPWGEEYPLPIVKLGVDVVVEDQVARVALDQTFRNTTGQALEGVYRFAIPPDAALQRLAMYVDGTLMESAVVERMQARRIYEELVYRRVDPALLEWAGTGRLALRVYPIPAMQDKRLMLAYTQSLSKLYDDWTLTIPLPEVDQPVGAMDVSVRVKRCASCELSSPSHAIAVTHDGDDAIVTFRQRAVTIGDSFVLRVRDARAQVTVAEAHEAGEHYVLVRAPGELAGAAAPYRPRTWVILDDVSASRDRLALRAQADVIDALFRELDENDHVSVIAFDVAARTKLPLTRVLDVDRHAVRQALAGEGGVGATDAGVALDAAVAALAGVAPDDAMIVYLGDGVITSGARNLDALRGKLAGKAHFVGVGLGDGPDTQTLGSLAAATGGYATTIDLADDLAWRTFDLVAALHTPRITAITARLLDAAGQPVPSTSYLASPQLAEGEQLELVAKVAATPAAVELTGTRNGAPWQRTIRLDVAPSAGGYLPRLWAQRHIAARLLAKHEPVAVPPCSSPTSVRRLPVAGCSTEAELREQRDEAIRKEVIGLGKRYFLLSRHTSLLVLENDAMYAQYGVVKGAGDTWAPYAMPRTIPVSTVAPPPSAVIAGDDPVIRAPLQVFDVAGVATWARDDRNIAAPGQVQPPMTVRGTTAGPGLPLTPVAPLAPVAVPMPVAAPTPAASTHGDAVEGIADKPAASNLRREAHPALDNPFADELRNKQQLQLPQQIVDATELPWGLPATRGDSAGAWAGGQPSAVRMTYPGDPAFDDLTSFVPALSADAIDQWHAWLGAADPPAKHTIDPGARALLIQARRALPTGIYRWGDIELAVDDARRLGWRRTTEAGLDETASFDGTTWTRRYAELGLDVVRTLGADDLALALDVLPVWIPDPAHVTAWFDVGLRGAHEVVLSRQIAGKPVIARILRFDDRARLVAITGPAGEALVEVTWTTGPAHARVVGHDLAVGFTGEAISDAPAWAHRAAAGVVVELPMYGPAHWQARLAAETAGSPAWRHLQRQLLASLAAAQDRGALAQAYEQLRRHGGIELGDLVLASAGVAAGLTDAQLGLAVAPFAGQPIARYQATGRAFATAPPVGPDRIADGLIRALWSLRQASAEAAAGHGARAADAVVAIGDRAPLLRLVGASMLAAHGELPADDLARGWDAAATGAYRNVARAAAAQALFAHGQYDAGADRVTQLVADLDLTALPIRLDNLRYGFQQARRGLAGWQPVWATWRARVLAGASYDHVMTLLSAASPQAEDPMPILALAAQLAGGDVARTLDVARAALARGRGAWAEALVRPVRAAHPSRAIHQLLAAIELSQNQPADALDELEAAQDLGDAAAGLASVRAELGQIVEVARQLAVLSDGAARAQAIARALRWGDRWRAIDPGNAEIDRQLGELLLAVGDEAGAWRQLSSAIERDPWSGAGYTLVAETFERRGKVADALAFWQQAIVIDQTNPTPRLRKAQALIALGRGAEGDAILDEILRRPWHDVWSNVIYQAHALRDQGKRAAP
jgi:Vault protein inter-alpha-trypsin domain/von Willebrand factor type A domain/FecR protein